MQVDSIVPERLNEELNPFADFDGVAEDDHLAADWQTLQIADHQCSSLDIAFRKADRFSESLGEEE